MPAPLLPKGSLEPATFSPSHAWIDRAGERSGQKLLKSSLTLFNETLKEHNNCDTGHLGCLRNSTRKRLIFLLRSFFQQADQELHEPHFLTELLYQESYYSLIYQALVLIQLSFCLSKHFIMCKHMYLPSL